MIITEYIPIEKFHQFHEILCSTGGRYLKNPFPLFKYVKVHYVPGDYKAQQQQWKRCITTIKEVRRDQWWRIVLRRCGFHA